MDDMPEPTAPMVSFTSMADGTREDYELLDELEEEFVAGTADRVLAHLRELAGSLAGYQVDRLEHSLQTATTCWPRTATASWPRCCCAPT